MDALQFIEGVRRALRGATHIAINYEKPDSVCVSWVRGTEEYRIDLDMKEPGDPRSAITILGVCDDVRAQA